MISSVSSARATSDRSVPLRSALAALLLPKQRVHAWIRLHNMAQQPKRRLLRHRNDSSSPPGKRLSVALTIALGMMVLFYLSVVVVITILHFEKERTATTGEERWRQIMKDRGLVHYLSSSPRAIMGVGNHPREKNPFDRPWDAGVVPDVLVRAPESVAAIKLDPPDDHPAALDTRILTAFLEPLNWSEWRQQPLPSPRSTAQASQLTKVTYTRLNSCSRLPQQWPVDDSPVDVDSFLPWIHDVFPTADGQYIQIVAQNKRRCKNGSREKHILQMQQPQAALFQHVSVKRETKGYRLVPHEEADSDGVATRFICKFQPDGTETLSDYNFDYEWTGHRKRYKFGVNEDDAGLKQLHTSQLIFRCPVPDHLVDKVRTGETVTNDWATMFLDIIPIRTPPRYGPPNLYFPPYYKSEETKNVTQRFDPVAAWGPNQFLPSIEDSGRWANIPICKPSLMTYEGETEPAVVATVPAAPKKKHRLVSCIWASAGYTTRGNRFAVNDGQRRLLEWITYNQMIGFDHVYVYDNSGAFSSDVSLKPIADILGKDLVTHIPWPSQICNNGAGTADSKGERSSQYAAEQSCRLRFGPHVDWIGQFDIDEYMIPMGKYKTASALVDALDKEGTKIVSFASWRAWPRRAFIEEPVKIEDPAVCWHREPCFELRIPTNYTMLQSYNCDQQKPGQKVSSMPAEKQIYRPDYVLSHFVHYSVATVLSEKNQTEYTKEGFRWKRRAFPDPRQRFADEPTEGLMVHAKSMATQDTAGWERTCRIDAMKLRHRRETCRLGVPFPEEEEPTATTNATSDGWAFNCYVNPQVENYLAPRLHQLMQKHETFLRVGR